jgi:hypothetical protein
MERRLFFVDNIRVAGYVGILVGVVTVADDVSIVIASGLVTVLTPVNGLLWLSWWLMMSPGLLRLARRASYAST